MDGVVIDYAKDKRIVRIELMEASKRTALPLDLIDLAIIRSRSHVIEQDKGRCGSKGKKTESPQRRIGTLNL